MHTLIVDPVPAARNGIAVSLIANGDPRIHREFSYADDPIVAYCMLQVSKGMRFAYVEGCLRPRRSALRLLKKLALR